MRRIIHKCFRLETLSCEIKTALEVRELDKNLIHKTIRIGFPTKPVYKLDY